MKSELLQYLVCPECGSYPLELQPFQRSSSEIFEGILRCSCQRSFPIIGGIPRLLPDGLRVHLKRYHKDYFERYPDIAASLLPADNSLQDGASDHLVAKTFRFYSFLHPRLVTEITRELRDFWASAFALRIQGGSSFFSGKIGLDAGCGEGRYSWHVANQGAEVIGVDLSEGVNVAYRNTMDIGKVHIVQASLYNLPIRPECLDFVFSTGVLHHLPDPRRGFNSLIPVLKPGGHIMVWVYGLTQMNLTYRLSHLTFLRGVGSRLEPKACFALSVMLATALNMGIYIPVRILATIGFRDQLPQQLLEAARLPFIWKVKEAQDRIGVPVTHYLTRDELIDWFQAAGFTDIKVVNTNGRGWYGTGTRI